MARISTYIKDPTVVGNDKWIGTDSQNNNQTKNFTATAVARFINDSGAEEQNLRYRYNTLPFPGLAPPGTINFDPVKGSVVNFNTITSMTLSKFTTRSPQIDVSSFYTSPLIASDVLISQTNDLDQWAIYRWNSSTQNLKNSKYYDIGLTYVSGNGSLKEDKDYFISLLTYDAAGQSDRNFVFTQGVPSSTWVIDHNLNKFASVSVVDTAKTTVFGEITYNTLNKLTITFSAAFAGQAYLN